MPMVTKALRTVTGGCRGACAAVAPPEKRRGVVQLCEEAGDGAAVQLPGPCEVSSQARPGAEGFIRRGGEWWRFCNHSRVPVIVGLLSVHTVKSTAADYAGGIVRGSAVRRAACGRAAGQGPPLTRMGA
ncbi:hypothetical protein GCM10009863_54760 [Streptomyces axinellae]|uniref:Uncharacterized protein n=1 Tax=Streptomyces axinellae TaxID=552788 RepID=A0ABP6CZE7_9ACTN